MPTYHLTLAGRPVRLALPAPAALAALGRALDLEVAAGVAELGRDRDDGDRAGLLARGLDLAAAAARGDRPAADVAGDDAAAALCAWGLLARALIGASIRSGSPGLAARTRRRILDALSPFQALVALALIQDLARQWAEAVDGQLVAVDDVIAAAVAASRLASGPAPRA